MAETQQRPSVTHFEIAGKGYHVIPIIPPDAPLSPNSRIKPEDRGKIPGRRNSSGHWAGYDWLHYQPSDAELDQYAKDGAGIGVVCGEPGGVVALDVDCPDEASAQWVYRQAERLLGWAPKRIGHHPKFLLVFRVDVMSEPITWRKVEFQEEPDSGNPQLVELRAKGQQFVAYGTHPKTQLPYTWPDVGLKELDPEDLTPVDADDIAQFFETITAALTDDGAEILRFASGTGGDGERDGLDQSILRADTQRLDEALAHIPNTSEQFPTRDDYIRFGCAIKAAYADDPEAGYRAWLDWAYRWEDGAHGDNEPEEDWERMKPPFEIGANYIFETARANGYRDADQLFEQYQGGDEDDEGADTGTEFWDRYVWVEELERFIDLQTRTKLSKSQFAVRFPHIGSGISSNNNAATVYLENPSMRRVVLRTTYRPGDRLLLTENGDPAVNTWRPGPAWSGQWDLEKEVSDDDVAPYLKLVHHLFPDERERNLLLDWLAFQVQYPGRKCSWHPVIGGTQGIGKDSLVLPVIRGIGQHNTQNILPADLHSQWTDWVDGTQLLVVQEMNNFARKETMDKVKPLMATPPDELRVNIKGLPQYMVPNIINVVFFTNHPDAVALEIGDRRFFIIWSDAQPLSASFYTGYYRWLKSRGGAAEVCRWLYQRDLSDFNPSDHAPSTEAKQEMRRSSMSPLAAVFLEAIESEDGIFNGRDLFTSKELTAWAESNAPKGATAGPTATGRALREAGAERLGRFRVDFDRDDDGAGSGRANLWAVRAPDRYKSLAGEKLTECYRRDLKAASDAALKRKFGRGGKDGDDDADN